jgi:kanamycin kinase
VTFPSSQPPVPAVVGRLAAARSVHAVWVNEKGGVTFRVGSDMPGREFIKVANANTADLAGEARRLRWASHHLPVPTGALPRPGLGRGILRRLRG